jgi:M6 family metalloprotease-like protein
MYYENFKNHFRLLGVLFFLLGVSLRSSLCQQTLDKSMLLFVDNNKLLNFFDFKFSFREPAENQIPSKPPGKNFRLVALYFKLADDQFELGKLTAGWPHAKNEPNWKGKFLIDTPFDAATYKKTLAKKPESLTAYFYQMSNGQLWLYGDEVAYTGPSLTEAGNENERYEIWQKNNAKILQWFADGYNLTKLDNNKDGEVDLILLICRARPKFGFAGEANLSFADKISSRPEQPQITSASGAYQTDCYRLFDTRHIVAHEIGHLLGFWGHDNGLHRWNLMSGAGDRQPLGSGVTMSAFERHRLSWLQYEDIDKTTPEVSLGNLTQSHRAIRLPIKNSTDYFVLENRQYSEPFEPRPHLPGTGLLIYYVANGSPTLIPADGKVTRVIGRNSRGRDVFYNGDDSDLFGNFGATAITPYTTPSTSTPTVKNTGIAIKNIHYSGKNIVFDVYYDYIEQSFAPNKTVVNQQSQSRARSFQPDRKIFYQLPQPGLVKLLLYDAKGKAVATLVNEFQEAWDYEVDLKGLDLAAGVYSYTLETNTVKQSGKVNYFFDH